jgi:succinate dehydrogenase / fumarate reductase flavoprotein subunit
MATSPRVVVVGGGLAGLMATIKCAEAGATVDLMSLVPVKRSHSACAQGGINGAVNTKGEGDSPEIHFYDTVKGGDFVAHQPLCKGMAYAAPSIIYLLDRMGVTFNRTPEGNLDFRRFGGTLHHRTAFAGSSTGQQLLYALDEQVRRFEAEGLVNKYEFWEFLDVIKNDSGQCVGAVAMDLRAMQLRAFPAHAVILATGGPGMVYGRSTNSTINTSSAGIAAYKAGVKYANGEYIQIHPTAIPGNDKLRLMSEAARGEGGRVWVPRKKNDARHPNDIPEADRWYFLEERYPRFGNLVPRDVASREIYDVCINEGLGIGGKASVYLDLTHKSREELDRKLKGILEIYEKFAGTDPHTEPMRIFPAVHYSMGGVWVDYETTANGMIAPNHPRNHSTNIPGLYAAGECEYQYHGANRLGANALLSCIYAGSISGPAAVAFAKNQAGGDATLNGQGDKAVKDWEGRFKKLRAMDGPENPYKLHYEMGETMIANVLIVRENKRLAQTLDKLKEYRARWNKCSVLDNGPWTNQSVMFLNQLDNMLTLAEIITKGALLRDECRGAHYKPEFLIPQPSDFKPDDFVTYSDALKPENKDSERHKKFLANMKPEHKQYAERFKASNDEWLKTTIATDAPDGPKISYEPVNVSLIPPRPRKYD